MARVRLHERDALAKRNVGCESIGAGRVAGVDLAQRERLDVDVGPRGDRAVFGSRMSMKVTECALGTRCAREVSARARIDVTKA
jgi:hypothetical protein